LQIIGAHGAAEEADERCKRNRKAERGGFFRKAQPVEAHDEQAGRRKHESARQRRGEPLCPIGRGLWFLRKRWQQLLLGIDLHVPLFSLWMIAVVPYPQRLRELYAVGSRGGKSLVAESFGAGVNLWLRAECLSR